MQLKQVYKNFEHFFFEKEKSSTMGIVRICLSLVLLFSLLNDLPFIMHYYSNDGLLSGHTTSLRSNYRFSILDTIGNPIQLFLIYALLVFSTIMLLIGKYTRLSAVVTFVLLASFHEKNVFVLNSGDTLIRLLIFYLIFAPSNKSYSFDSIKMQKRLSSKDYKTWQSAYIWPRRLMQIQLIVVYFFAFISKTGITWKGGTAIYYFLSNPHFARFDLDLSSFFLLTVFLTYFTILTELLFPILVWFRSLRRYALIAGISLNMGILLLSNIFFFSLIMIVAHLVFINPKEIEKVMSLIKTKVKNLI
jgi:hypothetical protein